MPSTSTRPPAAPPSARGQPTGRNVSARATTSVPLSGARGDATTSSVTAPSAWARLCFHSGRRPASSTRPRTVPSTTPPEPEPRSASAPTAPTSRRSAFVTGSRCGTKATCATPERAASRPASEVGSHGPSAKPSSFRSPSPAMPSGRRVASRSSASADPSVPSSAPSSSRAARTQVPTSPRALTSVTPARSSVPVPPMRGEIRDVERRVQGSAERLVERRRAAPREHGWQHDGVERRQRRERIVGDAQLARHGARAPGRAAELDATPAHARDREPGSA